MPSTIQRRAVGPDSPTSSPSIPSPGRSSARMPASRCSTARSVSDTGLPSAFSSAPALAELAAAVPSIADDLAFALRLADAADELT